MMQKLENIVCIKPLKNFSLLNLTRNSHLRVLILSESDEMTTDVFLVKMGDWLKLLTLETKK